MTGLVDFWTLDVQWQETPFWLRWMRKPRYRAHTADWRGDGRWVYSDTFPSYGGIDRASNSMWRSSVYQPPQTQNPIPE